MLMLNLNASDSFIKLVKNLPEFDIVMARGEFRIYYKGVKLYTTFSDFGVWYFYRNKDQFKEKYKLLVANTMKMKVYKQSYYWRNREKVRAYSREYHRRFREAKRLKYKLKKAKYLNL